MPLSMGIWSGDFKLSESRMQYLFALVAVDRHVSGESVGSGADVQSKRLQGCFIFADVPD